MDLSRYYHLFRRDNRCGFCLCRPTIQRGYRVPVRLHPNVRVMVQHLTADMARESKGLVRYTGLGEFRNAMMTQIMES
jgi:hypothetical protein